MQKVASPQELQTELRRILAYSQTFEPSRQKLAAELRSLADRVAAKIDEKGSGDYVVYFETDSPKTLHRWHQRSKTKAIEEAVKAQKEHGGYITVQKSGIEVAEVGPGGKVKT